MDRLDELLRGFQNLESLDLRSENGSDLQMIAKLLAAIGSPSVRMHINGYPCDVQTPSMSPKPWSPAKQQTKRMCCARIKDEIGTLLLIAMRVVQLTRTSSISWTYPITISRQALCSFQEKRTLKRGITGVEAAHQGQEGTRQE